MSAKRKIKRFYSTCDTRIEVELDDGTNCTLFLDYETGKLKVLCNEPHKLNDYVPHQVKIASRRGNEGELGQDTINVSSVMLPVEHYGHPYED